MTSEKSGEGVTGKMLVGPWEKTSAGWWFRGAAGVKAFDIEAGAVVRVPPFTPFRFFWSVWKEGSIVFDEGEGWSLDEAKAEADARLEAAGWTIAAEPDTRAASNRAMWGTLGLNGGKWIEGATDREQYLMLEHERLDSVIEGAQLALDNLDAPTHGPWGAVLSVGERALALVRGALDMPAKSQPVRPKVSHLHARGDGAFVVDDHGSEVGAFYPNGGVTWGWTVRRPLLPPVFVRGVVSKEAAREALLEALREWADVEGECQPCAEALGSPSVCAITHDFRPGAYDGPKAVDLAEEIERASFVLAALDCGGSGIEAMARGVADEIRRLRKLVGDAHGILKRTGVEVKREQDNLSTRAAAVAAEIERLRGAVKYWMNGSPTIAKPAGPLSCLWARSSGCGVLLDRAGPWGEIIEAPNPPGPGLWLWTGTAEREVDPLVGGYDFSGQWTSLPLPVLS